MKFIREGDKEFKKLSGIRSDMVKLRAEIKTVTRAPLAPDDVRTRITSMLDARAHKDMPEHTIQSLHIVRVDRLVPAFDETVSWGMLSAILGRDVLENRLFELSQKSLADRGRESGLEKSERTAKIAQLEADIRAAEIAEIHEMLRLQDAGLDVLPRADADCALMLQVWGELGGPADEPAPDPVHAEPHINDGAVLHRTPDADAPPGLHSRPK